jgi:hypothetical protein
MLRITLRALGTLTLVFLAGLFVIACQDEGSSVAGVTSVTAEAGPLETTAASASRSGSSGSPAEDDTSDDDTSEDSSTDDDSDDVSDDDDSDDDADDESTEDDGIDDVDDSEVKGLFFGTEDCPSVLDCVVALRIKDTLVVVTSETEIVNETAGEALVSPSDLVVLVGGHPGLPMRAEGSSVGGALVAQKIRIDDEIRATGEVVAGAPGCVFGLVVRLEELCFGLSPGVTPPLPGSTVRVEGLVPSDFSLPFLASQIEPSDD